MFEIDKSDSNPFAYAIKDLYNYLRDQDMPQGSFLLGWIPASHG